MLAPQGSVIVLDAVSKSFADPVSERALDSIDLEVASGEVFGIIGESGAGKTTLLNVVTATARPTAGAVTVLGREVATLDRRGLRELRREIGVVFQGVHLLSNRTVGDNVALPLALAGAVRRERSDRVREVLAFVGLEGLADRYPAQLSGGQRQRVGIARALAGSPRLLVCDEPTASLDAATSDGILRVLLDARDRLGTTVVVVTHDLDAVAAVCDRVALLESGRLKDVLTVRPRGVSDRGTYLDRARRALAS